MYHLINILLLSFTLWGCNPLAQNLDHSSLPLEHRPGATTSVTAPRAINSSITTMVNTPVIGNLSASFAHSGSHAFSIIAQGSKGSVVITNPATGAFTYTPHLNQVGFDLFTFQVTVGDQTSNTGSVSVTINSFNTPPVTTGFIGSDINEDSPSGLITLPYSDADLDLATSCNISGLNHVSVTQACACVLGVCTLRVTGASNYHGAASFDFTVTANGSTSNASTASFTINSVDDSPVSSNITPAAIDEDTQSGAITLSYSDADGDLASACSLSDLLNVTVSEACVCASGICTVKVTGVNNYHGAASFNFKVTANGVESNTSSATFTINSVADVPVTSDMTPSAFNEDTQSGLITLYYSDGDGDLATSCTISNLSHVSVTQSCACVAGVCTLKVTGASNYHGAASFDFSVTANGATSNISTASFSIISVDDVPVSSNITPSAINEDTQSGAITLLYLDPDGDEASSCAISGLTNVTVTEACACASGVCTVKVTGTNNYHGPASFTYTVTANGVVSNSSSATFTINSVNDAPVTSHITPDSFNEETQSGVITLSYTDVEGDHAASCSLSNLQGVTVSQACACSAGVCTVRVTGTLNHAGAASFDYTVTGDGLVSNTSTATFTINGINDAPSIGIISNVKAREGNTGTASITVSDVDNTIVCSSDNLSITSSNTTLIPVSNIVWSGTAPNCVATLTHATGVRGSSTLNVTVSDGSLTSSASFTYNVVPNPIIELLFNENSTRAAANTGKSASGFSSAVLSNTSPSWSLNTPPGGGMSSIDFGTDLSTNYFVDIVGPVTPLMNLTSFTVTAWINCRSNAMGSGGNRVVSWQYNGTAKGADIVFNNSGSAANYGSLRMSIGEWPDSTPAVSNFNRVSCNSTAPYSNWQFIAITYDSTKATNHVSFYFGNTTTEAALDVSRTYARGALGIDIKDFTVGHFNADTRVLSSAANNRMFRGLIDQVRVFGATSGSSGALSLSEIREVQAE